MKNPDAGELRAAYQLYGLEIPKGLVPPDIYDIENAYWQAFCDLAGDRQDGGSTPWATVRRYWEISGLGNFNEFKQIIFALDSVIIKARKDNKGSSSG